MNRKYLLSLSTFLMLTTVSNAFAYTLVLFTDDPDYNVGIDSIKAIRETYPFNKFDIKFKIARTKPADLDCNVKGDIERLITCQNSVAINAMTKKLNGDQALVVKNVPNYGGSSGIGAGIPVITSGTPPRAMLHEFLHTLGLCDEYEYKASEADRYCLNKKQQFNIAFIDPLPSYSGDSEARALHASSIQWFGDIAGTTPITNSNGSSLGTQKSIDPNKKAVVNNSTTAMMLEEPTGLYPSGMCENASQPIKTWKPSGTVTVMQNMTAGLSRPLEERVEKVLLSRGAVYKTELQPYIPPESLSQNTSTAEQNVDNSGRNFVGKVRSFVTDIYERVRKAISK